MATASSMGKSSSRRSPLLLLLVLLAALVLITLTVLREESQPETPPAPAPSTAAPAPPPPKRTPSRKPPKPVRESTQPVETSAAPAPAPERAPAPMLQSAIQLTVIVRRSSGGAAVGAHVLALDPLGDLTTPRGPLVRERGTAGEGGRAVFEIRGGTNVLRVLAALEEEAALSSSIDVGDGKDRTVELDLRPATTVRVRVVSDADQTPIAGSWARLTVVDPGESWPVKLAENADADGVVTFLPLPLEDAARCSVEAGAKGFLTEGELVRPATLRSGVFEMRLVPAIAVTGRVVDEAGAPVVNALAKVVGRSSGAASGPDGRFETAGLPADGGDLWVQREDFAPTIVRGLRGDAGAVDVGNVVLRKGSTVEGVVVSSEGKAVAGAQVKVVHQETGTELEGMKTGEDGRFRFDRMPDEPLALEATEGGRADWAVALKAQARDVRPGGGEVRLVLSGAATVFVRFLHDADRSKVVVTSVKLTAAATGATPTEMAWAWSGSNIDSVRFQPEHTGVFDVTIEIPGYQSGTAKGVEVAPDRETRIDVLFRRQ